ncbi:MAG: O-antigen ligase family protein [Verrucomicrobia bacterium]|nr:O-antigen ligase family protein [Verrucomicrobiota bacterium]
MTSPAASASAPAPGLPDGRAATLPRILGAIGLVCLAVITLASPGATRMYAWPWSVAYAGAVLAPVLALLARAFDPRRPLVLPSGLWCAAALASAITVLASALTSTYRESSLLWSAPLLAALASFLVAHDALRTAPDGAPTLRQLVGLGFGAVVLTSMALWLPNVPGKSLDYLSQSRNGYPLGHSNYTAGLAILALPWFTALALRSRGPLRLAWSLIGSLAFVMFLSSSSRSGMVGLAAAAFTALLLARFPWRRKLAVTAALVVGSLALVVANPRTRTMLTPGDPAAAPNLSNVQRAAMVTAAQRMGSDRPLLGWGPGTTPLVYPSYRAGLDAGAENVLQLHSTPAQLWAELGVGGLLCALLGALALLSSLRSTSFGPSASAPSQPVADDNRFALAAASALVGYAVFCLADWQLDVPAFGFAVACLAASLAAFAAPPPSAAPPYTGRILGFVTLSAVAVVILLGHRDPAPELNVRALDLARDPARRAEAITLLRQSLALNPDQEIAHFNLGWLLVVRDPADAERHFLEALHLVPDKGGVYFGLGLSRLNQNRPAEAARAFALECLSDPLFLSSPWWREPAVASVRAATATEFSSIAARAQNSLPAHTWAATQLAHVATLTPGLLPTAPNAPELSYRRERTAYPVLMRNLDLPPPIDLYDVREFTPVATTLSASPLPPKGWLPTTLLLELLDAPTPSDKNRNSKIEIRK